VAHLTIPWHRRLEARVLIATALVVGLSVTAVLVATRKVVTSYSLDRSSQDLVAARAAFTRLIDTRRQSAAKTARLIVDLPTFREPLTNPDVAADEATLSLTAEDFCGKLGATFCVITNATGTWIGKAGVAPDMQAAVISRTIEAAQSGRSANGIVSLRKQLLLVVSEPARFASEILGTFSAGFALDDAVATELALVTNSDVNFLCPGLCGSSLTGGPRAALAALAAETSERLGAIGAAPGLKQIGPVTYVSGVYPLSTDATGSAALVLLKDWAPTDAALSRIHDVLLAVGALTFGVVVAGALWFSRGLTRPIRDLVTAAGDIANGKWAGHVPESGPAETRRLARAFNQAAQALQDGEAQLRQAQKMEAVGQLAGGVAHDFNNLLTAILGYSDLLLDRLPPGDPNRTPIAEIAKAGRSAASLTRDLLAFSRKQVLTPVVLEFNAVVKDTDSLLRRLVGEGVEVVLDLGRGVRRIKADPGQISQVLLNLAANARDAMPDGGRLTIRTRNVSAAQILQPASRDDHVLLTVSDTGSGMTAEILAHIFEPFFTTKDVGKGTGLGLATVEGIVAQSGGRVWVESAPGAGTTFFLAFPATDAMVEVPGIQRDVKPVAAARQETVMLVEDNDAVRALAHSALTSDGYQVIQAVNGEDALKMVGDRLDAVALVLTDVVMPIMGGRELVSRLRAMRPDIKIVFTSGYASDPETAEHARVFGAGFIQKPFVPSALRRTVREALDAR
jgi:signal transduction histidine kinase